MSRLLVLGWHNVASTWCFPSEPDAGHAGLSRQLRVLRRYGTVLPLQAALERLATGDRLPPRAVALTFDDGYADNLTLAAPLLGRLGLPATFFLVPGLLDGTTPAWWEKLAWAFGQARNGNDCDQQRRTAYRRAAEAAKNVDRETRQRMVEQWVQRLDPAGEPPGPGLFLDWAGARSLAQQGFTIGSHSSHHAILSRETPEAQRTDLLDAAGRLRAELGINAELLAYPNGGPADYNAATEAAAVAAGHRFALTTRDGLTGVATPPLQVRRCVVSPEWDLRSTMRHAYWSVRAARAPSTLAVPT